MSQRTIEHNSSDASAQPPEDKTDISLVPFDSGGQLTLTQQPPLSPATTVVFDASVGDIWRHIAATDGFQRILETAVTELVGDLHAGQRALALEQLGVTALDGLYASAVAALADKDPAREQWQEQAFRLTQEFGSAERSVVGFHAPVEVITDGPLAVFRAATVTPTIAVRIDDVFDGLRADQRADIIALLADLASAVDLRIVATGRWQRKLTQEYREELPGVSEQCTAGPSVGTIAETVEQAREVLDPSGQKVRILRQLAAETAETLSYNELCALHDVTDGAVKQCLTTSDPSLTDLGLIETFSRLIGRGNAVELLAAGRELLDRLDSEIGRQSQIGDSRPEDEGGIFIPCLCVGLWHKLGKQSAEGDGESNFPTSQQGRHRPWKGDVRFLSARDHIVCPFTSRGYRLRLRGQTGVSHGYDGSPDRQRRNVGTHE